MIARPEEALRAATALAGARVRLRRYRESDIPAVLEYGGDPETVRHLVWAGAFTLEEATAAVRDFLMPKPGAFAITLADDVCIGGIDLRLDETNEKAAFGYVLNRKHWNKGYMTEALNALLELSFERLELGRVESEYFADNPASGRVMEKCDMRREGVARREKKIKGVFKDVVHYAILREEWLAGGQ